MKTSEIDNMSTAEKLQTMEYLWGSLEEKSAQIDSPDWHGEVLSERMKKIENGEAKFMTLEQLKVYRQR